MTNVGKMTFSQCQTYALTSGNKYFGLQEVDENGNGNCMINNQLAGSQIYGVGNIFKEIALWASNTSSNETNNPGSIASLSINGSLVVINSSGANVYVSDNSLANPGNYLGCYTDSSSRAIPLLNNNGSMSTSNGGDKWDNNYESTFNYAYKNNYKYFSTQAANSSGYGQGGFTNNLTQALQYGKASNCTNSGGYPVGGSWSNAVYSTNMGSNYFLILQDDGNLCVYRGTSPNDNQGYIWCSMTNGKQQQANPNFTAVKGKYGKNWISNGSTLAAGDWIGSTNGSIYLIMQSDGNLVLYTNTQTLGCNTSSVTEGKIVGRENINSLYEIENMGNKNNIGQLAYIDENSEMHLYSENNKQGNDKYSLVANEIDSGGNDIPGASFGNATLQSCQNTCNNNSECAGFVMNKANDICWPKTSNFYPNGNFSNNSDRQIYVRGQSPINYPIGVSNTVNNIDSLTYQSYVNGGALEDKYGLSNASSVQKQQLEQLQSKMNLLTSQINELTGKFGSGSQDATKQMNSNVKGIKNYLQGINKTNNKIINFDTNVERILNDSDIVVLQKNYNYLFWSILAVGSVLVTMNIIKK
jgi:hypothetical protein